MAVALLVVDVTNYLTAPTFPTHFAASRGVLAPIAHLAQAVRGAGGPVFYSRGGKFYFTSAAVPLTDLERGPWLTQNQGILHHQWTETQAAHALGFDPAIAPQPTDIIIDKTKPSAFFGTPLGAYLTQAHVDTLVVCGMVTSGCVRATVTDAFSYNYRVWLAEDACADSNADAHAFHLEEMGRKYARRATVDTCLTLLAGTQ